MDKLIEELRPTTEDRELLNKCLKGIEDVIARSNKSGLELDFQHWAQEVFGNVTGYGIEELEIEDRVPQVFMDSFAE